MNPAWLAWLDRVVEALKPIPAVKAVYRGQFLLFPTVYAVGPNIRGRSYKAVADAMSAVPDPPHAHAKMVGDAPPEGSTLVWKREGPT